jgi:hypothetical protein
VDGIGLLAHKDIIIVGDMNFTISFEKVWGQSTQLDSLVGFFKSLFLKTSLVDVVPSKVIPMWHNDKSSADSIEK